MKNLFAITIFAMLVGPPSLSVAQVPDEGLGGNRRARGEVFLGYQKWDGLAQLSSPDDGSFSSGGFSLGGAHHWNVGQWGHSDILAGLDFALFSNESNVHHISEDVISRGLYITPSIKLMFDNGRGRGLPSTSGWDTTWSISPRWCPLTGVTLKTRSGKIQPSAGTSELPLTSQPRRAIGVVDFSCPRRFTTSISATSQMRGLPSSLGAPRGQMPGVCRGQ